MHRRVQGLTSSQRSGPCTAPLFFLAQGVSPFLDELEAPFVLGDLEHVHGLLTKLHSSLIMLNKDLACFTKS